MKNNAHLSKYALALVLAATSVTVTAGSLARGAWDWRGPYSRRASLLNRDQENRLQQFLRHHQGVYRDLQRDPQLANDRSYLRRHDDFREFLSVHPGIRDAFRTDPYTVMGMREYYGASPRNPSREGWRNWGRERWRERYR